MSITSEQLAHRRHCRRRWVLNALTGWNALAPPPMVLLRARRLHSLPRAEAAPMPRVRLWHERVGVIHVHTTYSDGLGGFEEVAAEAQRCGLDFMITSDHGTLAPLLDGKAGYYGDCLVLVGVEITCDEGYVLGLDLPPEFEPSRGAAAGVLSAIRAAGGQGFLSLVCDPRFAWRALPEEGFVGMEVINMGSQGMRTLNLPNLARALLRYRRSGSAHAFALLARRPTPELRAWDRIAQQRPVAGIGSVDAHAKLKLNGRHVPLPSYRDSFQLLRTHVLCGEGLTDDGRRDAAQIYEALSTGRCFFSYHIHGDATGFRFHAASDSEQAAMGGEIRLGSGVRLLAGHRGEEAIFRLFRNGVPVLTVRGDHLDTTIREAGVYRVEVLRWIRRLRGLCIGLRPWIYTNPIYVRPGHAPGADVLGAERPHETPVRT